MGKDFVKEIACLEETYRSAINSDVTQIAKFLKASKENSLISIGSGGSYSAAYIFSYFNQKVGKLSKAITPLELTDYANCLKEISAVLLTAGGRNADALNAYKYLAGYEAKNILTICMRKNAPISTIQKNNMHNMYYDFETPNKKDGFLAVNSLFATIVIISKAFYEISGMDFFSLPKEFNNKIELSSEKLMNLENALRKKTIILLHGGITTPIAVDMESKFSEAALGNIQLVDFRNFAHGRHYWISQNLEDTSVISLIGCKEKKLAEKTLKMLPENLTKYCVYTDKDNIENFLMLFNHMLFIVYKAGQYIGINPGRPKVSDYGRKIYHISYNFKSEYKNLVNSTTIRALYRKLGNMSFTKKYLDIGNSVLQNINNKCYKGIIFDYDGTLIDKSNTNISEKIFLVLNEMLASNIIIGISTGRGKSVRHELQKVVDKKHWNKVYIAYYNGQVFGTLNNEAIPNNKTAILEDLKCIHKDLAELKSKGYTLDLRPYQLTIVASNGMMESNDMILIQEIANRYIDVKVVKSSHSVDVIQKCASKRDIIQFIQSDKNFDINENNVLFIGDSGELGGNDYDLLLSDTGLSVNHVSKSLKSCWNFAPFSVRGVEATLYYLDSVKISDSTFTIEI